MIKQGYLSKRGEWNKRYKRRFFRLFDGSLQYYSNCKSLKSKGSILLKGSTLIAQSEDNEPNGFQIRVKKGRTYRIKAETAKERNEWLENLLVCDGVIALSSQKNTNLTRQSIAFSCDEEGGHNDPMHLTVNGYLLLLSADISSLPQVLDEEFQNADENSDGKISQQEIQPVLGAIYKNFGYAPLRDETLTLAVQSYMEFIHTDEDGQYITKSGFCFLLKFILANSIALTKITALNDPEFYPGDQSFFEAMCLIARADEEDVEGDSGRAEANHSRHHSQLEASPPSSPYSSVKHARNKSMVSTAAKRNSRTGTSASPSDGKSMVSSPNEKRGGMGDTTTTTMTPAGFRDIWNGIVDGAFTKFSEHTITHPRATPHKHPSSSSSSSAPQERGKTATATTTSSSRNRIADEKESVATTTTTTTTTTIPSSTSEPLPRRFKIENAAKLYRFLADILSMPEIEEKKLSQDINDLVESMDLDEEGLSGENDETKLGRELARRKLQQHHHQQQQQHYLHGKPVFDALCRRIVVYGLTMRVFTT